MSHDARTVANVMIEKGLESDNPLTPLQIIKLTYFCQAWMLAMYGKPMFSQKIQAWEHGPVIPDVYHNVKQHGKNPVRQLINARYEIFDADEEHILNEVYRVYGGFSGLQLSSLTHMEGSPWYQVKANNPLGYNKKIDNEMIREFYAKQLERRKGSNPTS